MFINKNGLNFTNGGHRVGDEIKIKTVDWFTVLNIAGFIWGLIWILIFWSLYNEI